MGLLSVMKRTAARTRVAQQATQHLIDGKPDDGFNLAKAFVESDSILLSVLSHHRATPDSIYNVYNRVFTYTGGDIYRGHAVAVSAILDADTLSYLLRAEHGDVDMNEACDLVQQHFHTSTPIFQPERQYRIKRGL